MKGKLKKNRTEKYNIEKEIFFESAEQSNPEKDK